MHLRPAFLPLSDDLISAHSLNATRSSRSSWPPAHAPSILFSNLLRCPHKPRKLHKTLSQESLLRLALFEFGVEISSVILPALTLCRSSPQVPVGDEDAGG